MSTVPYAIRSHNWRAAGLCGQCGEQPLPGRKMCTRHAEKAARANARRKGRTPTPSDERRSEAIKRRWLERIAKRAAAKAATDAARRVAYEAAMAKKVAAKAAGMPPKTWAQYESRWTAIKQIATITDGVVPVRSSWFFGASPDDVDAFVMGCR